MVTYFHPVKLENSKFSVGMPTTPFRTSSLNTTNIGRSELGLVVMGCVVDVFRMYYPVLNDDVQKGVGAIS